MRDTTPTLRLTLAALAALLALPFLLGCPSDGDDDFGGIDVGADADRDGVTDGQDNCPNAANSQQFDADGDGFGNVCDNCPYAANPNQQDLDLDGVGDACEGGDADGDGVRDVFDNCPFEPNPDQANGDLDGLGDACDADQDGDGIPNDIDPDLDGDGIANGADTDADNRFACGDTDDDDCDDCSSGVFNPNNDGTDANGDGICDAGARIARLMVRVTAPQRVFAVQTTIDFPVADLAITDEGVAGAGPYDPDSYLGTPPGIVVTSNTLVAGEVTAAATFTSTVPDPSFLPPADVLQLDFVFVVAPPTLGTFDLDACEVVDANAVPIAGATCTLSDLDIDP
jgi:hypothetical protein